MPRRNPKLILEPMGDELLVYCSSHQEASCLDATASWVLQRCDGATPLHQVAEAMEGEQRQARLEYTLAKLHKKGLVEGWTGKATSRRQFLSTAGRAAVVLPTIASVLAPTPAAAASVNCVATSSGGCAALFGTASTVGVRRFTGCAEGCTNSGSDPTCTISRCATFYCADPNNGSGTCTTDDTSNAHSQANNPYCGGVFATGSIVSDCAQGRSVAVSTFNTQAALNPNLDTGSFNCPVAQTTVITPGVSTIFRRMFEYICCDCPA